MGLEDLGELLVGDVVQEGALSELAVGDSESLLSVSGLQTGCETGQRQTRFSRRSAFGLTFSMARVESFKSSALNWGWSMLSPTWVAKVNHSSRIASVASPRE